MANGNRGELEIHIGKQTRTLRFRTAEVMLLEERLGMDVIGWLGAQKGSTKFLVEAVFCGLLKSKSKVTPNRVMAWFDDDDNPPSIDGKTINRNTLLKEILYAIAKGKPKEESEELVGVLDELFEDVETEEAKAQQGPLAKG